MDCQSICHFQRKLFSYRNVSFLFQIIHCKKTQILLLVNAMYNYVYRGAAKRWHRGGMPRPPPPPHILCRFENSTICNLQATSWLGKCMTGSLVVISTTSPIVPLMSCADTFQCSTHRSTDMLSLFANSYTQSTISQIIVTHC